MNNLLFFAIFIDLLVIAALLVWFVISIRKIEAYLRRIALSLQPSAEQMQIINGSISTEAAMAIFEKAGGSYIITKVGGIDSKLRLKLPGEKNTKDGSSSVPHCIDPEIVEILNQRELLQIVRSKAKPVR